MIEFTIKYKKSNGLFWKKRKVIGIFHNNKDISYNKIEKGITRLIVEKANDQMILYYADKTQEIISNWTQYDFILGMDWLLATKEQMEKESGQQIKLEE